MIAKTNHKVDQFFQKKTPVIIVDRPMPEPEEEKKENDPAEASALPQQPNEEEKQ